MNIRNKLKRFFTLNCTSNNGFTLVELIVVIAILAILGGVAVPAYSGYVKKAERSADEALLNEINTAFASACLANGESNFDMDTDDVIAYIDKDTDRFVYTNPFVNEFNSFFESKEGTFKVMESLVYDSVFGGFIDPSAADTVNLKYAGAVITMTGAQIQVLKDSSYFGDGMTSEKLLNQVDNVAVVASGMGAIDNIFGTDEFKNFACTALGLESGANLDNEVHRLALEKLEWTQEQFEAAVDDPSGAFVDYRAAVDQVLGNALVLYTAQQTTNLGDDAKDLLIGITSAQIADNMEEGKTAQEQQTGMNRAALAYGMYYAYVNSDACTDSSIKGKDNIAPTDVTTALDSNTEFKEYMNSTQGKNDMKAYLEALSMINQGATGNPGAVENLLTNGFVDMNSLLTSTMGK